MASNDAVETFVNDAVPVLKLVDTIFVLVIFVNDAVPVLKLVDTMFVDVALLL